MDTKLVWMNTGVRYDPTIPLMPGQRWVGAKGGGLVKVVEIHLFEPIDDSKYKLHLITDKLYSNEEMEKEQLVEVRRIVKGSAGKYGYFKLR